MQVCETPLDPAAAALWAAHPAGPPTDVEDPPVGFAGSHDQILLLRLFVAGKALRLGGLRPFEIARAARVKTFQVRALLDGDSPGTAAGTRLLAWCGLEADRFAANALLIAASGIRAARAARRRREDLETEKAGLGARVQALMTPGRGRGQTPDRSPIAVGDKGRGPAPGEGRGDG
ncbi:MAG: hypothetical protein JJ902_22715 [Roseibium sp.]|nr:hypothetical protein [Roseibium sp.]